MSQSCLVKVAGKPICLWAGTSFHNYRTVGSIGDNGCQVWKLGIGTLR
jgi:hypothetical protein